MGLKIKHMSGEVKSETEKSIILNAGEQALFGIPELKEADVADNKVEWILLSQNRKDELRKCILKKNELFPVTIDKLTSGSYSYHLEARYTSLEKKEQITTDSITISSYCTPCILNISSSVTGELTPGDSIKIDATLEGLNSSNLALEVYSKNGEKEKKIHSETQKCIEGKVSFSINSKETIKWKPKSKETDLKISFKLFDKNNKKYLNYE